MTRPFEAVDRMFAAFAGVEGFLPYTFVADAITRRRGRVQRSFRYETEGACAIVETSRTTPGTRRIGRGLCSAGYERWFTSGDDSFYRRWLSGQRHYKAELRFLRELGDRAAIDLWPTRAPTRKRPLRSDARCFIAAIEAARDAAIDWTGCCVGFRRNARMLGGAHPSQLTLFALAWGDARGVYVSVNVRALAAPNVSTEITKDLRRELRSYGLSVSPPHSDYPELITGHKWVRGAGVAAIESARLFDRMVRAREL